MSKRALLILAAVLMVPSMAVAQYPGSEAEPPSAKLEGLVLSFGTGFGGPFGKSDDMSRPLSDIFSGQIPVVVGLGYRINPLFSLGMDFQHAWLLIKNCTSGASCSGHDTRLGFDARLHFAAQESFSPWISAGVGYEWMGISASGGGESSDGGANGIDFDFQLGGDFRVSPVLTIGPFFQLRAGQFGSESLSRNGSPETSVDVPSSHQTTHGWWLIGVRGAFTIAP